MVGNIDEAIASNVRAELARRRYTQADLSVALGLTGAGISDRLRGRTRWTCADLQAVADFLGVPYSALHQPPAPTAVPA